MSGHNSRVRVLHILPMLETGGAEAMAVNLMCGIDEKEFEMRAVSLTGPIASTNEKILLDHHIPVAYLGKHAGFDHRIYRRIDQVIREFKPAVVHTHLSVLRYALPLLWLHRTPATYHTVHAMADREVGSFAQWIHYFAFRMAVKPVSIANEVSNSLRRVYGLKEILLVPNAVPTQRFAAASKTREDWRRHEGFAATDVLFVSVARMRPIKNQELLIKAFAHVANGNPQAKLLLAGGSVFPVELNWEASLRTLTATLGLENQVHFLGERSDIPELLTASDVFMLSSHSEGNPLSVMEAMSAGLPVIATSVGGVPELLEHGIHGFLTTPNDISAMADAMSSLLHSSETRQRMGTEASRHALENFDLKVMVERYSQLYREGAKRQ